MFLLYVIIVLPLVVFVPQFMMDTALLSAFFTQLLVARPQERRPARRVAAKGPRRVRLQPLRAQQRPRGRYRRGTLLEGGPS